MKQTTFHSITKGETFPCGHREYQDVHSSMFFVMGWGHRLGASLGK